MGSFSQKLFFSLGKEHTLTCLPAPSPRSRFVNEGQGPGKPYDSVPVLVLAQSFGAKLNLLSQFVSLYQVLADIRRVGQDFFFTKRTEPKNELLFFMSWDRWIAGVDGGDRRQAQRSKEEK